MLFRSLIKTHNFHQLRRSFDPISLTETICFRVHRVLNLNLVYFINQKTNIIINKLKIAPAPAKSWLSDCLWCESLNGTFFIQKSEVIYLLVSMCGFFFVLFQNSSFCCLYNIMHRPTKDVLHEIIFFIIQFN